MADDHGQMVSYPLTTVLDRIESAVNEINHKLDKKADRAEVVALAARLEGKADQATVAELAAKVEGLSAAEAARVSAAQQAQRAKQGRIDWSRWLVPTLMTAVYTLLYVVQFLR